MPIGERKQLAIDYFIGIMHNLVLQSDLFTIDTLTVASTALACKGFLSLVDTYRPVRKVIGETEQLAQLVGTLSK